MWRGGTALLPSHSSDSMKTLLFDVGVAKVESLNKRKLSLIGVNEFHGEHTPAETCNEISPQRENV